MLPPAVVPSIFGIGPAELLILALIVGLPVLAALGVGAFFVVRALSGPRTSSENLIPCPDCRRMVSRQAPTCPGCGRPLAS